MTPRERVFKAVKHEDTLPWQIDMTESFAQKLRAAYTIGDADQFLGNHLTLGKYKIKNVQPDGSKLDLFGVRWATDPGGGDVGVVTGFPMSETTSFSDYTFPKVDHGHASAVCDSLERREGDRFTFFGITMCFFERAWSLRGMENILMDMALDEPFACELFDRIEAHHMEVLDEVLDRDFDGVYFGDDWGQQQGLIMGPPMWRKYIKPAFARMFDKIKRKGKVVCLHSCGDNREILGDLVDMGLDIYNTLQPEIYDLAAVKREYGKDLTFYGGISTQQFLPFATPEEVKEKVREVTDILAVGGGYILAPTHCVTSDIPVENVIAILEDCKWTR